MATMLTHLAIAKLFIKNNPGLIKNELAFFDGNVEPDLDFDKENSHFGKREIINGDIPKRNEAKIGIAKFLDTNKIDNDYNLGRLLHLCTDLEYYKTVLPNDYVRTLTWEEYLNDIRYTWWLHDVPMLNKCEELYSVTSHKEKLVADMRFYDNRDTPMFKVNPGRELYTIKKLEEFIKRIAKSDLLEIAKDYTN